MRTPALAVAVGLGVAVSALLLAAVSGGPYLTAGDVNGWIVVFAVGLFAALFASPFLIERTLAASRGDADSRWDYALPLWGAVALGLGGLGLLVGLGSGFGGDSLAGSAALITAIEAGMVVLAVAAVMLSS
ncbi:MAG TPA: hypothetical protein VEK39_12400 [Solirubrobacterales bacterium]|nr:hypothetical protein [Solirubrobacterales bacterium]